MDRKPIQFPPGVVRKGSPAEMQGQWYEANLIRWVEGVMRPVGGIERIHLLNSDGSPFAGFASTVRATHVWSTQDGRILTGILCEEHLYVMTEAGTVTDITPEGGITEVPEPEIGGYGDEIYYGAGGGLAPPLPPYASGTPLPPIFEDPNLGPESVPGGQGYGAPRGLQPAKLILGEMWTLDNFGDLLLAMISYDRRLLVFDPNEVAAIAAEVVPTPPDSEIVPPDPGGGNAPRGRFFIITPERHCMVFACTDDGLHLNRFEWCAQENIKDWLYSNEFNSAGFYDIEPSAPFVAAVPTRTGILAFTTTRSYLITYYGDPYFYAYTVIGYFNAPISGHAVTRSASSAVWLASDGFWQFDGVNVAPLPCPILDYVQTTIDPLWGYRRSHAIYLGMQSEVWFFYPAKGQFENNLYVCYNFDEKWWSMGKLSRTCGTPGSTLSYPLLSDGQSLYLHEKGLYYADAPELPYAVTAAINVGNGGRQVTIRQGIVDTRAPADDVHFRIGGQRARITNGTEIIDEEIPLAVRRDGGKLDFRVTGRDIYIRIESARNGVEPWTFGQMLVKLIPRGSR